MQDLAEDARSAGLMLSVTIATAFGCPFEGEVPKAPWSTWHVG